MILSGGRGLNGAIARPLVAAPENASQATPTRADNPTSGEKMQQDSSSPNFIQPIRAKRARKRGGVVTGRRRGNHINAGRQARSFFFRLSR